MKITFCTSLLIVSLLTFSCKNKTENDNVLLNDFNTPHETVPFDAIKIGDYLPAIETAITTAKQEIERIANNEKEPDFINTIEPLDKSSLQVVRLELILRNMIALNSSDSLQGISQKIFPMIIDFENDIYLHEGLFDRVLKVYQKKDQYDLSQEQQMLLENTYIDFIRRGANLSDEDKMKYRSITAELSGLTLTFGNNVLKETNGYQLHISDKQNLAGLPEQSVEAAAQKARSRDLEGWVFTLQPPSYTPFMQYAENRELREQMYKALMSRAFHGDDKDNSEIIRKIVNLRLQLANILGYKTYADYVLTRRMIENSQRVNELNNELLNASMPFARREYDELQKFASKLGADFQLMAWDISFYSTQLKKKKYDIDDEMTRPFFKLENVQTGIFELANRLYGISFKENKRIQVPHPEVKAYEVFDADGSFLAVLYLDFFPRENKRGGAWTSSLRQQYKINNKNIRPHRLMGFNFTEPTESTPSLLTIRELTTFLHEFGHALHGIFSDCTYSGTGNFNIYRDFIELPSQIMENWVRQKEWINKIAIHYETGDIIPEALLDKYMESINYRSGESSRWRVSGSILDMAWYSITVPMDATVKEFETNARASAEILPSLEKCLYSAQFTHIFSKAYAAGIYSYLWSEVMAADAFELFNENGIFDKATAQSFRENILSKGASEHPMELYKKFRGREPGINALLERRGLSDADSSL